MSVIETNFKIPKHLRKKRYILQCEKAAFQIKVCGARKIAVGQRGEFRNSHDSMVLDWIQETIEGLRLASRE